MKPNKLIFFIFLMPAVLTSCFDLEREDSQFQALKAYFESEKKFYRKSEQYRPHLHGRKKTGAKKKFYYDLSYELKLPDSFKNIMTVKADESHFS